jgi:type III restriction enzyme
VDGETSSGSASSNAFFEHPILNSPYECPPRHWELDGAGQPTQKIIERRRSAKFITPIPKPKKRKTAAQPGFVFDEDLGLSTKAQAYDPTSIINEVRGYVDRWRSLRQRVLDHLAAANRDANPELMRLALKLANGCGQDDRYGHDHRVADGQCRAASDE